MARVPAPGMSAFLCSAHASLTTPLPSPGSQVSALSVGSEHRGCCCWGLGWAVREAVLTGLSRAKVSSLRPCTEEPFWSCMVGQLARWEARKEWSALRLVTLSPWSTRGQLSGPE